MPYSSISELPPRVKDSIPSDDGKRLFLEVFNSTQAEGRSEQVSFSSAWAALQNAGYERTDDGWVKKAAVAEAEYHGRDVALDKPFRLPADASKKFGVYVKDGGGVKRVTFGSPDMEIKRDDPDARASFRARHNCDAKTDKTSAGYWSCKMWEPGTSVSEVLDKEDDAVTKRYVNDDVYTLRDEAAARSHDLGLGGAVHVHEDADGRAVYMPGNSHEEYLQAYGAKPESGEEHEAEEYKPNMLNRVIGAVMDWASGREESAKASVPGGEYVAKSTRYDVQGKVLKVDGEQGIVYGWASVVSENGEPVIDTQGDVIAPDEMVKAVNDFMLDVRVGKVMHEGGQTGVILHSLPVTKDIANALGIETDREGWVVGYKVSGPDVLAKVKSGELTGFSIGGEAQRVPFE